MRQLSSVVALFLAACAGGCGQSAPASPTSPSAPSSLAAGSEASSATVGVTTLAAPAASYDATGSWHFKATERTANNQVFHDEGDSTFTQDQDGNIQILINGDTTPITLTRLGSGRTIAYRLSVFETHPRCNTDFSGTAQIDTVTNTLQAHFNGIEAELDCSHVELTLTATKNLN